MEDFSKYLSPSEYHDETMKACREHAIGEFTTDTIPIPKPVGEQLLVKISACGVCGGPNHKEQPHRRDRYFRHHPRRRL